MTKTIIRRFLIMIPQVIVVSIIIFVLAWLMPGDALSGLIDPNLTAHDMHRMREALGLNDPMPVRYVNWVTDMFQGDFGISFQNRQPVMQLIGDRALNTVRLSALTIFLTYLICVPLGLLTGRYRETLFDKIVVIFTFMSLAMPTVILALICLFIFGFELGWVPVLGSVDPALSSGTWAHSLSIMHHLIMPAVVGALLNTVFLINVLRSEVIDNENSDYVITAKSKGVPMNKIYSKHIFRNASLPIAASLGFILLNLISGSIFVERIFGYPGMGNLFVGSIISRDFPTANMIIMIFAVLTIASTLVSDIILTIVDPRLRIK